MDDRREHVVLRIVSPTEAAGQREEMPTARQRSEILERASADLENLIIGYGFAEYMLGDARGMGVFPAPRMEKLRDEARVKLVAHLEQLLGCEEPPGEQRGAPWA